LGKASCRIRKTYHQKAPKDVADWKWKTARFDNLPTRQQL